MLTCTFEDGGSTTNLKHATVAPIVVGQGKLLVVKRALYLSCGGKYGLPGGYMDKSERVFESAMRETYEETGYETHNPRLFIINDHPHRKQEDRQNLDFTVLLEAGKKTGEPDHESLLVGWFDLEKLPPESEWAFDHFDLVERYLEYRKNPCPLPIVNFEYTH